MKRRDFIKGTIAGGAGLLFSTRYVSAAENKPAAFDPYELVPLGKTGVKVSRVGFGTGMKGRERQSNQTRLGKEKFERMLRETYERGIRFFDCADLYGSHPYIIPALKGIPRENYVISSKIWWMPRGLPENERPEADVVVGRFLKELQTDYIDIVQLHCVQAADWPAQLRKYMDKLDELKQKGIIRAHGVSVHSLDALAAAAEEPWVDCVHARINPFGTAMDGPVDKVVPVLKKIHDSGKGVVGMKLIGEGAFRNSDELRDRSAKFVLELGCVDTMIVGFESIEEVDDFARRVRKVTVS